MIEKISIDIKRQPVYQISNVAYKQVPYWFGSSRRNLEFNIIKPANSRMKNSPLIIWLCGGGWQMMDRTAQLPEMLFLAEAGYVVAGVDYRMSSESQFPTQVEDVKAAIRYLRKYHRQYGFDPDRVALMGASSGGHLSLISAYTDNTDIFDVGENLDESSHVKAVINLYGPVDFKAFIKEEKDKFNYRQLINLIGSSDYNDERFIKASPITYVGSHCQPTLIIHGNKDSVVPVEQAHILYNKLKEFNIDTELLEIEGATHVSNHFYQDEIKTRILNFLSKHL